jgi:hypothetical protein
MFPDRSCACSEQLKSRLRSSAAAHAPTSWCGGRARP